MLSESDLDELHGLLTDFLKTRAETDKIMLKIKEWVDFNKMPQKNLAKADEEVDKKISKIIKMIKKFNKKRT